MTDDRATDPYHPSRVQAGPLSERQEAGQSDAPSGTPAEAQFPYIAAHGIQPASAPPAPAPDQEQPAFGNRRPERRQSSPLLAVLIGVGSGLFVLAVLAAYLVWGTAGNPVAPTPTASLAPDATPDGAVRGYLQALAVGDADAALGYAVTPPDDPTLLTEEVLATMVTESPITGIEVSPSSDQSVFQRVPAEYLLGDRLVAQEFNVFRQGPVWRLETVATEVDLARLRFGEVPLTINGVALATATPSLFPGSYTIATDAPRYTVRNPDFTIESPTEPQPVDAELDLSEEGRAEVVAAAEAHLEACVKQRELAPEECGFSIANPKGTKLKESTMRWSVRSGDDELDQMEISLDHPGSATAAIDVEIRGRVRGTDGSRWEASSHLTRMRADLTGEEIRIQFA